MRKGTPEKKSRKDAAAWPARFQPDKKRGEIDLFMRAFLTIRSGEAGGSALFKKKLRNELLQAMEDLGLGLPEAPPELREEWRRFAKDYLDTFVHSRSYGSTLFGMMQLKPEWVLEKLVGDLQIILTDYPARFGLEKPFVPLKNLFREVFMEVFPEEDEPWPREGNPPAIPLF